MTQYFISDGIGQDAHEIRTENYIALAEAIDRTKALFRIEGLFHILAREYVDFEELIARLALRATYKIREDRLSGFFDDASTETSAKLAAFFSISRSYEEQTKQKLNGQQKTGCSAKEFAALLSNEYDRYLEYRIGYSLRNYLTHESLLGVSISAGWKTEPDPRPNDFKGPYRTRRLVSPRLRTSFLIAAKKIKRSVKDEVAALGCESIDLLWLVRNYVSSIATVHSGLRKATDAQLSEDLTFIREQGLQLIDKDLTTDSALRLSAGKPKLDPSETYVSEDFLRALWNRRSGWKGLQNARSNYFTSEILSSRLTFPVSSSEVHIPIA